MANLHDQYQRALKAKGWALVTNARSAKYTTLSHPAKQTTDGAPIYIYLGSAGAIRIGRNIASSRPMSDRGKANLLDTAKQPETMGL